MRAEQRSSSGLKFCYLRKLNRTAQPPCTSQLTQYKTTSVQAFHSRSTLASPYIYLKFICALHWRLPSAMAKMGEFILMSVIISSRIATSYWEAAPTTLACKKCCNETFSPLEFTGRARHNIPNVFILIMLVFKKCLYILVVIKTVKTIKIKKSFRYDWVYHPTLVCTSKQESPLCFLLHHFFIFRFSVLLCIFRNTVYLTGG